MSAEIIILSGCEKELKRLPQEIIDDLWDAIAKLRNGLKLTMPLSRSMSSIENGLFELRINDRSGAYRIFYFVRKKESLFIIHAFKKTTQKTPSHTIELVKKRLGTII